MRTPTLTAKRALGLTAAAALAVSGTLVFASSSQAAVQTLKLSAVTGGATSRILSVSGNNFTDDAGDSRIGVSYFSASACAVTPPADAVTVTASDINVQGMKKMSIKTPALTALLSGVTTSKAVNLCVLDNETTPGVLGTGKYTLYNDATFIANPLSKLQGPTWGGMTVTIKGTNFTAKTRASIDDKLLTKTKVTLTSTTDSITGVIPANTPGAKVVKIATEAGVVSATGASGTFTYVGALSVEPKSTVVDTAKVVTVTGTGFLNKEFTTGTPADGESVIAFAPAGALIASGDAAAALPGTSVACTNVQIVSDTELTCAVTALAAPAAKAGAYTLQIADYAGATVVADTVTAVSADAAFTIAAF